MGELGKRMRFIQKFRKYFGASGTTLYRGGHCMVICMSKLNSTLKRGEFYYVYITSQ